MKKTLISLAFFLSLAVPFVAIAQVLNQNQVLQSQYFGGAGTNSFLVSNSSTASAKLVATSSPFFRDFSFTTATGTTLCLSSDCRSAWPVSFGKTWEVVTGVFGTSVLAPTTTLPIYVPALATSSIANFSGEYDVTLFSGSDTGAKINTAFATAANGSILKLSSGGVFDVSTSIVENTGNKNVMLDCQGSTLNYTGSGTLFTANTVTLHHTYIAMQHCFLQGPSRAGSSVALNLGGSNGAEGAGIYDVTIKGFGLAFTYSSNGYLILLDHVTFINNGKNFLAPYGLSNAGENIQITNSNISNDFSPSPSPYHIACFDIEANNPVTINVLNTSMDNCQIAANASTTLANLHLTNVYMESPGQNSYTPAVPFITIATTTVGTAQNIVSMVGGTFLSGGSTNKPDSYVYVGDNSTFQITDSEAQVGPAVIPYFVEGLGTVVAKGFTNNLFYNGVTNVSGIAAFSPAASSFGPYIYEDNGVRLSSINTSGFGSFGTSTLNSTVAITGGGAFPQEALSNNTGTPYYWTFGVTGDGNAVGGNKFELVPNGTGSAAAVVTVTSSGNFGVASTAPQSLFSVGAINGLNFSTATSTFYSTGGINLTNGCYAIGGVCVGGGYPFPLTGNATSTLTGFNGGLTAYASSTIGSGSLTGGLTMSGTATSTGAWPQFVYNNPNAGGGTWRCGVGATINAIGSNNFACSPTASSADAAFIFTSDYKVGFATSSPFAKLAIHANSNDTFRTLFAIGSSTATATTTLFTISNTGSVVIASTSPQRTAAVLTIGSDAGTTNGTSTISMGKIQFDGYNAAGARICAFFVGTTPTATLGACTTP